MSRSRYRLFTDEMPYLHTCTILEWLSVFTRPPAAQAVLDGLVFMQEKRGLCVYAYVIMENHIHFIAAGKGQKNAVDNFKSFTAREILNHLESREERRLLHWLSICREDKRDNRKYQLWQAGTHPEELQNEAMMRQKVEYIHQNPVRRGYVDRPEDWRYSSARNYAGMEGLIPVCFEW
ncbi:MAG: transposase [Gammaproteobacteria bacterium]|nr:transposase [Gammaproteobacteria bacterium]